MYGVAVDVVTMDEAVRRCVELVEVGEFAQQTSLNAGKVVMMQNDAALFDAVRSSALVCADGQAVVWASHLLGRPLPERVAGIDLMDRLLGECERLGLPVYFLGAREDVLRSFERVCRERFPALSIRGTHDGYFADDVEVAKGISALRCSRSVRSDAHSPQGTVPGIHVKTASRSPCSGCRRELRRVGRCDSQGSGLDAAIRFGVVLSVQPRAREALASLPRGQCPLRCVDDS